MKVVKLNEAGLRRIVKRAIRESQMGMMKKTCDGCGADESGPEGEGLFHSKQAPGDYCYGCLTAGEDGEMDQCPSCGMLMKPEEGCIRCDS